ncbi:MAG: enoyl-CoA hydratase/isomerase family protein [Candidatus Hodarchaeales archaeon]
MDDNIKEWEFEHIEVIKDEKNFITTLILDHPPLMEGDSRINTMGPKLVDELFKVSDLLYDDDTRVIILRGSKNCFISGADFGQPEGKTPPERIDSWRVKKYCARETRIFKRFSDMPKPVIAALEGLIIGAGLELALYCDLRYATQNALFGFPEVTVGMLPGNAGTHTLIRQVGVGRAMELILTGEMIPAQKALDIGMINGMYEADKLERGVYRIARNIAKNCAPIGVGIAKQMVNFSESLPMDIALELDAYGYGVVSSTEDFAEWFNAIAQGRKPKYQNK